MRSGGFSRRGRLFAPRGGYSRRRRASSNASRYSIRRRWISAAADIASAEPGSARPARRSASRQSARTARISRFVRRCGPIADRPAESPASDAPAPGGRPGHSARRQRSRVAHHPNSSTGSPRALSRGAAVSPDPTAQRQLTAGHKSTRPALPRRLVPRGPVPLLLVPRRLVPRPDCGSLPGPVGHPHFLHCRALAPFHALAQIIQLRAVEDLPRPFEHLSFLFLDVVLDVLLHDLGLGAPRLVVDGKPLDLAHERVHHGVLLVALEDDVLRLGVAFQLGIEDLLLDDLVDG